MARCIRPWRWIYEWVHAAGVSDGSEGGPYSRPAYTKAGLKLLKQLKGEWRYHLTDTELGLQHFGTCRVMSRHGELEITGKRTETEDKAGRRHPASAHWETTWCQLCADDKIRAEYTIDSDRVAVSRFTLTVNDDGKTPQLSGRYFSQAPNLRYGTITFEKLH